MTKRPATRTALLTARLPPEKFDAYSRAAESEGRTLTNWLEWHLDEAAGLRSAAVPPRARSIFERTVTQPLPKKRSTRR